MIQRVRDVPGLDLVVSVWVLFTFAVAQPLLDLLGRNPEFFLARAAPGVDIALVGLVLVLLIPGLLALLVLLARIVHPTAAVVIHSLLFVTLATILVVSILERTPAQSLPDGLELAAGGLIGLAGWLAYHRQWGPTRSFLRYASIGPPVFFVMFLFFSPSSQLFLASGSLDRPSGVAVGNPAPVVVVVFDEFPVPSLIDSEGNILEDVYPNFARLADEGVWFRNAMAVEQQTEHGLPAILTGAHPSDRDLIPMAADYPLNLFSLLSDSYEIRATESVTELCPEYACSNRSRIVAPAPTRWAAMGNDLGIVLAHLLLPSDMSASLPSINQTWGDFAAATAEARDEFDIIQRFNQHVDSDRREPVGRFLDMLTEPADEPTLYFAHLLFPHIPWTHLPSGQTYVAPSPAPGSTPTGWGSDEWLVIQAYQRHLLQVQYTDSIVGQIIDALESAGTYEESLLVIAADHGTADIPDVEHRRVIRPETVGHVAAIPLFIKTPNSEAAGVDDYRAETTDILPTIADVLDIRLPWGSDGTSLLEEARPLRSATTMQGPQGDVTFGTEGLEKLDVADWKESWFGSGDPFDLAVPGHRDLLGAPILDLDAASGDVIGLLDHPEWYRDVDLEGDPFPARITGTLLKPSGFSDDVVVAIGLNGRVVTVVRSYDTKPTRTEFQAMLPPEAFVSGANDIDLLLVEGSGEDRKPIAVELAS